MLGGGVWAAQGRPNQLLTNLNQPLDLRTARAAGPGRYWCHGGKVGADRTGPHAQVRRTALAAIPAHTEDLRSVAGFSRTEETDIRS